MGGCRCSFRDCKVNTYNQPRMHFFRYPLKDSERYSKWRQYAKTEAMLNYPEIKRKNMVICARHFRPECFMNFKLERLTLFAIPSISRLSATQALDYEQDIENGVLITLEKSKLKHLIAPDGFECPLDLDVDETLIEKLQQLENHIEDNETIDLQNMEDYELIETGDGEQIMEKPLNTSSNSIKILETIQVTAPHSKRTKYEMDSAYNEDDDASSSNKKTRLNDNNQHTAIIDNNTIALNQKSKESISTSKSTKTNHFIIESLDNQETQLIDCHGNLIMVPDALDSYENDNDVEILEMYDEDLQNDTETNNPIQKHENTLIESCNLKLLEAEREISELKKQHNASGIQQVKLSALKNENLKLKEKLKNYDDLNKKLASSQKEIDIAKNNTFKELESLKTKLEESQKENVELKLVSNECETLKSKLIICQNESNELKKLIESYKKANSKDQDMKKQFQLELQAEQKHHLETENKLQKQISTLEESLKFSQKQFVTMKTNLSSEKSNNKDLQLEKLELSKQNMEIEESLQNLQNKYDKLEQEHVNLKTNFNCLQQKYTNLEQKYTKLEALQNQVVTTSFENTQQQSPPAVTPIVVAQVSQPSAHSLTKAQLFNGIKRYVSASMVSLLRMEMFGSTEREWKPDERQVAVDILRLGDKVYKYLTDEWRFRLPALRDVRDWLSQSLQMDDEEDL